MSINGQTMGVQSALLSRAKYLSKKANPELPRGSSLRNAKEWAQGYKRGQSVGTSKF